MAILLYLVVLIIASYCKVITVDTVVICFTLLGLSVVMNGKDKK